MDANGAYIAIPPQKSTTSTKPSHGRVAAAAEQIAHRRTSVEEIQRLVCIHYRISRAELLSDRRAREYARPRQVAVYLAKTLTHLSLPAIGRLFRRDHTTIIAAVKTVEQRMMLTCGPPHNPATDIALISAAIEAADSPARHRITDQLERLEEAGFVCATGQLSARGKAEYIKALDDIPEDLLELAVDRGIRCRTDRRYPLPAHIRGYVQDELAAFPSQTPEIKGEII